MAAPIQQHEQKSHYETSRRLRFREVWTGNSIPIDIIPAPDITLAIEIISASARYIYGGIDFGSNPTVDIITLGAATTQARGQNLLPNGIDSFVRLVIFQASGGPPQLIAGTKVQVQFGQDFTNPIAGEVIATGDGIATGFSGTLSNPPLVVGSLSITDTVETFTDNSDGTLTGDMGGTGTIDYDTGAWAVTFNSPPANLQSITADYTQGLGNGTIDIHIAYRKIILL